MSSCKRGCQQEVGGRAGKEEQRERRNVYVCACMNERKRDGMKRWLQVHSVLAR